MLAVCIACEKFHEFIYDRKIKVHSDCKPLVSIISTDVNKVIARLQRLKLRILKYNLEIVYVPGKQLVVYQE